ncbi:hypothetical protein BN2497_10579 [Janthinobacterium sp. CG23_2]|nr:hypothetical protein BN2497_10579 [Janthinobacterium sp. CG23_2]CUU31687.1 hypothetical protein BN3177_10579 [Janthinobacterium sp. CG23_2]
MLNTICVCGGLPQGRTSFKSRCFKDRLDFYNIALNNRLLKSHLHSIGR